jgi:hypothetical protein
MAHNDMALQVSAEHALLKQVTDALRVTLGWVVEGHDCSRNLSALRFIARCFRRHLERLLALEESDGYMDVVLRTSPHLSRAADALKQEHARFCKGVGRVVQRLDRVSATDPTSYALLGDELLALLDRLDEHGRKEVGLFQEAFGRDECGGEG